MSRTTRLRRASPPFGTSRNSQALREPGRLFYFDWCSPGTRTVAAADEEEEKPELARAAGGDEAAKADGVDRLRLVRASPPFGTMRISKGISAYRRDPFFLYNYEMWLKMWLAELISSHSQGRGRKAMGANESLLTKSS
jgi:hypothetical protein